MSCNATMAGHPEFVCSLTSPNHSNHIAVTTTPVDGKLQQLRMTWPNEEYVSASATKEQSSQARSLITTRAAEIREAIPPEQRTKAPRGNPGDVKSKLGIVASFLINHKDEWIPGRRFTDPNDINGGANGLTRIRQLREHGFVIEERRDPDPNVFVHQYRLVDLPIEYGAS